MIPPGGHRGSVPDRSGGIDVLDTGTRRREWKYENPVPLGLKG